MTLLSRSRSERASQMLALYRFYGITNARAALDQGRRAQGEVANLDFS
jgi:hypothetical protein